jgi:hypothetical protein
MRPTTTRNATHLFQAPANWNEETDGKCGDLQVRAETFGAREVVELFSTWGPTPDELAQLNRGGVIEIGICSATQPAMQVGVVDPVGRGICSTTQPAMQVGVVDPVGRED